MYCTEKLFSTEILKKENKLLRIVDEDYVMFLKCIGHNKNGI